MNRTTGGIFLLPVLGTAVYAMLAFGADWRGSWDATTDAATGSTVLTGPLTAAFAAHVALAQSRMADLSSSTARGILVPYRSAFQAWAWSSVVYVLTAAGGFVVTAAIPHGGPFAWWAPLIGFCVLGACALAGATGDPALAASDGGDPGRAAGLPVRGLRALPVRRPPPARARERLTCRARVRPVRVAAPGRLPDRSRRRTRGGDVGLDAGQGSACRCAEWSGSDRDSARVRIAAARGRP